MTSVLPQLQGYREGFFECSACKIALIDELPPELAASSTDQRLNTKVPITVLTTHEEGQLLSAKSLLEATGIRFYTKNEPVQDLFGRDRFAFNPLVGPVELLLGSSDVDEAEILWKGSTRASSKTGPIKNRSLRAARLSCSLV